MNVTNSSEKPKLSGKAKQRIKTASRKGAAAAAEQERIEWARLTAPTALSLAGEPPAPAAVEPITAAFRDSVADLFRTSKTVESALMVLKAERYANPMTPEEIAYVHRAWGDYNGAESLTPPSVPVEPVAVEPVAEEAPPSVNAENAETAESPVPVESSEGTDSFHVTEVEKASLWNRIPGVRHFNFTDRDGNLLFREVKLYDRDGNKQVFQERPDGNGGWIKNLVGVTERPLYKLPELVSASADATIFIVEGPNKVELLGYLGLWATCNAMGAGKWGSVSAHDLGLFKGKPVVILADNDDAGSRHAEQVAASLLPYAANIKIVLLPDLPPKGDVVDWYEANKDRPQYGSLFLDAVEAAPVYAQAGVVVGQLPWPSVTTYTEPTKTKYKAGEFANNNLETLADAFLENKYEIRPNGKGGFYAQCPAHEDRQMSLVVNAGDDRPVIMHCHKHCTNDDILGKVGCDYGIMCNLITDEEVEAAATVEPTAAESRCVEVTSPSPLPAVTAEHDAKAAAAGWPTPTPLATQLLPVEPFPLEIFPAGLRRFAHEVAESIGVPVDYPAVSMLTVAGAMIGRSLGILEKTGYAEYPCLYSILIGESGQGKSPAMSLSMKPVHDLVRHAAKEYDIASEAYDAALKAHKDKPPEEEPYEPVPMERLLIDDFTAECVAPILKRNPRGLLLFKDEATAWTGQMDMYRGGRGQDRQMFLSAWSGAPNTVDRAGQKDKHGNQAPVFVPAVFISVLGGIPPSQLGKLSREDEMEDGFIQRILFCWPDALPLPPYNPDTERSVSVEASQAWNDVVQLIRLWLSMNEPPDVWAMNNAAKRGPYAALKNELIADLNERRVEDYLRPAWRKMEAHFLRFILIVDVLRHAAGEKADTETTIDAESVRRAALLVKYFQSHLRRTYAAKHGGQGDEMLLKIVAWIKKKRLAGFKPRDVQRGPYQHSGNAEDLKADLAILVRRNYIRTNDGGKSYAVNPAVLL